MNILLSIIGGVVAGLTIGFFIWGKKKGDRVEIPERFEVKSENLEKLKAHIAGTDERITNEMVQSVLGVSDATAVRYLDELEKEGIIRQVGATGMNTFYVKV